MVVGRGMDNLLIAGGRMVGFTKAQKEFIEMTREGKTATVCHPPLRTQLTLRGASDNTAAALNEAMFGAKRR